MFTVVCPGCGMYKTQKDVTISENAGISVCRACGHAHAFRAMPLHVVIGASGTGKSTLALYLQGVQQEILVLDGDLLWRSEFTGGERSAYFDMWMNLALNLAQCGKPVLLFMGGVAEDYTQSEYAKYFSTVNTLCLYAQQDDLVARLRARPPMAGQCTGGAYSKHERL